MFFFVDKLVWITNYLLNNLLLLLCFCFILVSSLSQNNINYFAINEANSPMAVLDLLEATMQIYHSYQNHNGGRAKNDSNGFTMGVVLVTVSEDEFLNPDVFPPNRLRPAYSMQGKRCN